MENTKINYFS